MTEKYRKAMEVYEDIMDAEQNMNACHQRMYIGSDFEFDSDSCTGKFVNLDPYWQQKYHEWDMKHYELSKEIRRLMDSEVAEELRRRIRTLDSQIAQYKMQDEIAVQKWQEEVEKRKKAIGKHSEAYYLKKTSRLKTISTIFSWLILPYAGVQFVLYGLGLLVGLLSEEFGWTVEETPMYTMQCILIMAVCLGAILLVFIVKAVIKKRRRKFEWIADEMQRIEKKVGCEQLHTQEIKNLTDECDLLRGMMKYL